MEIHNLDQEEIRPLLFNYLFHFLLFILIFVLHMIINSKIIWISDVYKKLYLFCIYLGLIYCVYPIIPSIMIFLKYFKLKIIYIFKKFSFIFLIFSIIIGLLLSAVLLINTINSKVFCQECPFNISLNHLNHIFSNYYNKSPKQDEIKDNCKSRRCILDSVNLNEDYPYIYLCNYDPSYDFNDDEKIYKRTLPDGTEITTKNQLVCISLGIPYNEIDLNHNELYSYLDSCYYLSEFYYCKRFNQPKKTYNIDLDNGCPETNYLFLLYILCVLIIIIDIVITMLPWGVEFISLKRIIQLLSTGRRKSTSNNSTEKSSVISNQEETFKKENTFLIISPLNNENGNILNINKKLIKKNSTNEIIQNNINNKEEDKKNENIRPISTFENSERLGLKNNLKINNSRDLTNSTAINVFNRNKTQQDINISTELFSTQNPNKLNVRDKIEEDNKNNK